MIKMKILFTVFIGCISVFANAQIDTALLMG